MAVVLAATLPLAGTGAVWSADEGALLYQATAVIEGRGWTFGHPFPAADPSGTWFPIHLASFAADGGYLVLGKHTVLVWLVGHVHRVGGYPGVLALSAASALVAASSAARLAGRIDRKAALPALWLTGVASPLFLSAFVAWGHTLAAALVGWAVVWLTAGLDRADDRRTGSMAARSATIGGGVALGLACLIRTEATLAAAALTMALAVAALARARGSVAALRLAGLGPSVRAAGPELRAMVAAGVGTVAGYGIDRLSSQPRLGPVRPPGDRWGGLPGRIEGFAHTWLRPDFSSRPEHLLLLAGATALIGAGIAARRRPADSPVVAGLIGLAGTAVAVRFALSPTALIPGLVVAFPLLFAGLALLRRRELTTGSAGLLGGFVALFWLAVLATQYRYGGGGEWGGRYFALGLPAVVPLAAVGLVRNLEPLGPIGRRRILGLTAVAVVLPLAMGILGLRDARERTAAITDRVDSALVEPGDGTGEPVVVTTLAPLGRWAWADVDRARWLLVDEEELPLVATRLHDLGVDRFVFVAEEADLEVTGLAPRYRPVDRAGRPEGPLDRNVVTVEVDPG